jgi:hypothetical protein
MQTEQARFQDEVNIYENSRLTSFIIIGKRSKYNRN